MNRLRYYGREQEEAVRWVLYLGLALAGPVILIEFGLLLQRIASSHP